MQFITLDGVVEDPDGRDGTSFGGWAFRFGPETVAGDKFRLGATLETGSLLMGRRTWESFASFWPDRDDPFADIINRIEKRVLSRSDLDLDAWANSTRHTETERDLIVVGSLEVARDLMARDLVDEYRLLVFPVVLGQGRRLFENGARDLELTGCERAGAGVLLTYR
ncbi:dihydrofolate reductase family protein [Solirubrobacter soli]|uniref:dihydrofolate reductase family protein n=1 Tax=Solirubrobacter soli TaxID=363832 RepID=UPI0004125285|nr:dihydrofolate reductase family protein [Solirubrobacter soli]